jgi:SWI/SNF-related matrix-associated actin-dependent regulator of chromatin subfamily A3
MMEADPEVTSPLFPHQQVALAWLVRRENSSGLPPLWEPHATPGATAATLKWVDLLPAATM